MYASNLPSVVTSSVQAARDRFAAGGQIVILETEPECGYLAVAAEYADAGAVNFMVKHGRGVLCLAITENDRARLGVKRIAPAGERPDPPPFAVSVEARTGTSTGISAADRARTIAVAVDPDSGASDLVSPGHVIPWIVARLLTGRPKAPDAAAELARAAGLRPAAAVCAVLGPSGSLATHEELAQLAGLYSLPAITAAELIGELSQ